MNRYLEIDSAGKVVNVIVWDGQTPYDPDGLTLLNINDAPKGCDIGWQLIDDVWVAPSVQEDSVE